MRFDVIMDGHAPSPPFARYTNPTSPSRSYTELSFSDGNYTSTISNIRFSVHRNVFALVVPNLDIYDDDMHVQTKHATYKEIQAWVKQHYGFHVSNLSISQTKERCGLSKVEYKGFKGAEGHYIPKLKPEKEAAIREAFIWFGLIKRE